MKALIYFKITKLQKPILIFIIFLGVLGSNSSFAYKQSYKYSSRYSKQSYPSSLTFRKPVKKQTGGFLNTTIVDKNKISNQPFDNGLHRIVNDSKSYPISESKGYYAKLINYNKTHSSVISSQLKPSNVGKVTTGFQFAMGTEAQLPEGQERSVSAELFLNPRYLITENWSTSGVIVTGLESTAGKNETELSKLQIVGSRENLKISSALSFIPNLAFTIPTTKTQINEDQLIGALGTTFVFAATDKAFFSEHMNLAFIFGMGKSFHKNKYKNSELAEDADADEEPKVNTSYSFQEKILPEIKLFSKFSLALYTVFGQKFNYDNKMTNVAVADAFLKFDINEGMSIFGGIETEAEHYTLYSNNGKTGIQIGLSGAF